MPEAKSTPSDVEALFALEDLDIEEVSLVDRGDNPGAQILMIKNAPDRDSAAEGAEVGKGMIREQMKAEEMYRHKAVFADMLVSLLDAEYEDESEFTDKLEGLVGEYAEIVRGYGMDDLSKDLVSAVDLSSGERADLVDAVKRAAGLPDATEKQKDSGAVGAPNKPAADPVAMEVQMTEKVKAEAKAPAEVEVEKKAPAVESAPVEDLAKERDDFAKAAAVAQERAAELEKRLAAVEERDALRSEVAKASQEFQHVGGASAEDLAKAMILIRKNAPAAVETLEAVLKAAEEAGKDAFAGRAAEGEPRPENKIEAYRAEVGKLKQERGLSHEQAMIALRKERPDLHAAAFGGGQ